MTGRLRKKPCSRLVKQPPKQSAAGAEELDLIPSLNQTKDYKN